MKLKKNILEEIKTNFKLRGQLMVLFDVSDNTILRWVNEEAKTFLQLDCLLLIASFLNLNINDLYEIR